MTDSAVFTDDVERARLCGGEIAHDVSSSLNVTIVNHRRPRGDRDTKVSRGLRRRGPIFRVEKLILYGTHHVVLARLLENCSEGHVRVERSRAAACAGDRRRARGMLRAAYCSGAGSLDRGCRSRGSLGKMPSVAWQYRHCALVTQDPAGLKNIYNPRGNLLLQGA